MESSSSLSPSSKALFGQAKEDWETVRDTLPPTATAFSEDGHKYRRGNVKKAGTLARQVCMSLGTSGGRCSDEERAELKGQLMDLKTLSMNSDTWIEEKSYDNFYNKYTWVMEKAEPVLLVHPTESEPVVTDTADTDGQNTSQKVEEDIGPDTESPSEPTESGDPKLPTETEGEKDTQQLQRVHRGDVSRLRSAPPHTVIITNIPGLTEKDVQSIQQRAAQMERSVFQSLESWASQPLFGPPFGHSLMPPSFFGPPASALMTPPTSLFGMESRRRHLVPSVF